MEKISYHNLLAVVTGAAMILSGCLVAYFFQKNLFGKCRGKVPNIMGRKLPDKA